MIGHGGGDPGYRAYVVRYPDQRFAIAVLGNLEEIDPARLAQEVADIYLSDAFVTPATSTGSTTPSVSLTAEQLASIVGFYRHPATGHVGRLFARDGKLMVSADTGEDNSVELTPVSASRFVVAGTTIAVEFVPAANGRAAEIHETGSGPKPIVSQKLDPFAPSSAELRVFEGEYTSPEVGVTFTITARDSDLVARVPGWSDVVLQPIFPDAFAGPAVNVVMFSRSAQGVVTGFTVNTNGVRGLRFDRVTR